MVDRAGGRVTPLSIQGRVTDQSYKYGYNAEYTMATYGQGSQGGYTPGITLGTPADWFGPLNPQAPSAPPEVAGRRFDFPSGFNLNLEPRAYEPIKYWDLQNFANSYDVLRTIIETRKDQMVRLKWNIKPRENAFGKKLTKPDDPILSEIRDFFMMPDGEQFWDSWLRVILEDVFVIDAPTLYCRRNRAGKLLGLDNVDGSTIKRIIDDWGRTPAFPTPAYQQALHGLPAVNYTTRDMIFRPRNMRAGKVYGFSQVEQVVMSVNIALRRQIYLLQYYTEGNMPEALIGAPDNWTPKQIAEFQNWFDSTLSGETGQRRHARFIPGGMAKTFINTKEGALTNETDEWLTRVMCFAFSITPTPFIRQVNRATAESQKEQALEEGLAPTQNYIKSLIDYIIWREWKRTDVEFSWEIPDDVNAKDQADVLTSYVKTGIYSINKALDVLGQDPIPNGDLHMALLPTGWVAIEPTDQFGASGGAGGAGGINGPATPTSRDPVDRTPGGDNHNGSRDAAPTKPADTHNQAEVGKSATVPFGKGLQKRSKTTKSACAEISRPEAELCRAKVRSATEDIFGKVAPQVKAEVLAALQQLNKASLFDGPISRQIANGVNLSGLYGLASKIGGALSGMASNAYDIIVGAFGYNSDDAALDTVMSQSEERAVELVSATGDMSIIPTTIEMIENIIQAGIDDGLTADTIASSIEQQVFSPARIEMIAIAETSRANSFGTNAAMAFLVGQGTDPTKSWHTMGDERVCGDICAVNELDGEIGVNENFSSGDASTPGHPRCRCNMAVHI